MSIPASHIKFSDDRKTAWVVFDDDDNERLARSSHAFVSDLDRPCDTCGGSGCNKGRPNPSHVDCIPCPACHGSGRPCFEIEVRTECTCERRTIGGGAGWYDHATDCPVRSIKGYLASEGSHFVRTLAVSVVPGMVLPIVDEMDILNGATVPTTHIIYRRKWDDSVQTWLCIMTEPGASVVTLPSAAAPGMFAVRLNVHTPIGAGS